MTEDSCMFQNIPFCGWDINYIMNFCLVNQKSNKSLISIFKTLEIELMFPIEVFITPLSILLIWEISIPKSLASCSCVKPCSFLYFLRFLPKAIKNDDSSKYSTM